jgi:mannose-6-phosphate isomerase-like protein (cupin superfamily)
LQPEEADVRQRAIVGALAMVCACLAPIQAQNATAQTPAAVATTIPQADLQAALKASAASAVGDQQLRVVDINGEYQVGVGVVHRSKPAGPNSIMHSQISEVYYMIEGTATLVTGGTMENPRPAAPDSNVVRVLNGPSTNGGRINGGTSVRVSVGDMVVVPPNTPHWFSDIESDQIVYAVVRVDPHRVLPAGYGAKP